jgi:hypothetical protein
VHNHPIDAGGLPCVSTWMDDGGSRNSGIVYDPVSLSREVRGMNVCQERPSVSKSSGSLFSRE